MSSLEISELMYMAKVSIIVPARNEIFLRHTIDDLLSNATGDVELIVILDGYWPNPPLPDYDKMRIIHFGSPRGMRAGENAAAGIATGKYYLKCDAHCAFGKGYDEILQTDCADNWIVIPRRYSLNPDTWAPAEKEYIDSEHLFYPYAHPEDLGLHARPWMQRGRERKDFLIDEDMSFQGSCWFMSAEHFHKRLGGLDESLYGWFWSEPQETGLKTQLGPWDGAIMRNKKTWYAHLHKGKRFGRMYHQSDRNKPNDWTFDYWWNNRWEQRIHNIEWMIDKFMPIPGWPENWKELKNG